MKPVYDHRMGLWQKTTRRQTKRGIVVEVRYSTTRDGKALTMRDLHKLSEKIIRKVK